MEPIILKVNQKMFEFEWETKGKIFRKVNQRGSQVAQALSAAMLESDLSKMAACARVFHRVNLQNQ
jgi:hypothetical protein